MFSPLGCLTFTVQNDGCAELDTIKLFSHSFAGKEKRNLALNIEHVPTSSIR